MAIAKSKLYTVEEFVDFAFEHEEDLKWFELVNGEIVERSPEPTIYSGFGHLIMVAVRRYSRDNNIECRTSSFPGTYQIGGVHAVAPDFAYKRTSMSEEYPDPVAPLWAVEIISPTDKAKDVRDKRQIYVDAGILYWEVYYPSRRIDVYPPNKPMQTFGIDHTLDGGEVLPGFMLPVRAIFGEGR